MDGFVQTVGFFWLCFFYNKWNPQNTKREKMHWSVRLTLCFFDEVMELPPHVLVFFTFFVGIQFVSSNLNFLWNSCPLYSEKWRSLTKVFGNHLHAGKTHMAGKWLPVFQYLCIFPIEKQGVTPGKLTCPQKRSHLRKGKRLPTIIFSVKHLCGCISWVWGTGRYSL